MKVLMRIYEERSGYVLVDVDSKDDAYDAALGVYSGDVDGEIEWTGSNVETFIEDAYEKLGSFERITGNTLFSGVHAGFRIKPDALPVRAENPDAKLYTETEWENKLMDAEDALMDFGGAAYLGEDGKYYAVEPVWYDTGLIPAVWIELERRSV